jgi:monofunctional biosynthetic peptidoglycan transglycosylase
MKKRTGLSLWWHRIKKFFLYLFIFQLLYIFALKWIDPPITMTQFVSWISGDGLKRDYVSSEKISAHLKLAVIASEDQLFPDHGGFDWKSIEKARKYNERKPGRIRGASTISQQTAKNVFLWQGRSWLRKGLEVYFTKMIEWIWGKKRILEVYLNVIEMGKGIYGAEAASLHFFKKSALKLSRAEASRIAACLPNPKRLRVNPATKFVMGRSGWVQRQMSYLERDPDVEKIIRNPSISKKPKKSSM